MTELKSSRRKNFNVGIVVPRYVDVIGEYYQFPLGLAYIAAAVNSAGYNVFGLNLNEHAGDETDLVADFIKQNGISGVLSGGLSPFIGSLKSIVRGAADIPSIIGGGVMGGDPLMAIKKLGCTYGVMGEGEEAVVELLDAIYFEEEFSQVDGIVYHDGVGYKQTKPRAALDNIDEIAWPLYDIFDVENLIDRQNVLDSHFFHNLPEGKESPRSIDIITSRSCPFMCTFCFHPIGKKYRERSIDDVIEEIKSYIEKYDINMVSVLDELFSLRKARLIEFCEKIAPLNVAWMVQLHTRTADEDTLSAMKRAGCVYISYGVESADNAVLKSMAKKTTVEVIDKALSLTFQHNIGIQGNLIFGDTNETLETANNSMRWWANNREYAIYLSRIQVFPGSPDYIMAVRDGLITDRDIFVETLPTNLNISNINQVNYSSMMFQLMVHGRTLLNLVKADITQDPFEKNKMDISYCCPKCNENNFVKNAITRDFHKYFIRIFCKSCHFRSDILNPQYVGRGIPENYTNPANMGGGSMFDTTLATERLKSFKKCILPDVEFVYAHADAAVHTYGKLLLENPFSPTAHYLFAKSLEHIGAGAAAFEHYSQALSIVSTLQREEELDKTPISILAQFAISNKDLQSEPYFVSFSDNAPFYRSSRDTGGYKNKEEPDFPDFRSISIAR